MNKKSIKLILIIEFIILLLLFSVILLRKDRINESIDIKYNEWYSEYIESNNDIWEIIDNSGKFDGSISLVKSPRLNFEKGSYTVTVWYQGSVDQKMSLYAYTNEDYIKANDIILDKNRNVVSCHFRLTEDIDNLEFKLKYSGQGDFSLKNVHVEKNEDNFRRGVVIFAGIFMIVDFFLYYHYASEERRKYLLILFGILFLSSLPLCYKGINIEGHDLKFHLMRIEGIVQELRNNIFPVRISSAWMGGYGYPVSVYYGDVLLYIPAAFRLMGFSITESYKVFVFLINVAAIQIAYSCFLKIFRKNNHALLLTLVYVTASYRLVTLYIRTAVGEYTALIFLPLLALAVYNIYTEESNQTLKDNFINGTIMAAGMTGIITAHILSAEMTILAMVFVCVAYLKKTMKFSALRTYGIAVGETLLFSAGFLIPFLDYYLTQSVNITDIVNGDIARTIQDKGANPGDFFAFFNNPFGNWHTMLFNPGIVLMAALILTIILWSMHKATTRMKMVCIISMILLILATNVFPWDNLAHDWALFDLIAQVQFPWRFIGLAIIFLTILSGFILEDIDLEECLNIQKKRAEHLMIAFAVGMTCLFVSYYADNAGREVLYDTENLGTYQVMAEEYLRTDTDVSKFTGKITGEGIVKAEIILKQGCSMHIYCEAGEAGADVTLPLLNYKGYFITDDAGKNYAIEDGENNLICFELPAGYSGNLYLSFRSPWYWNAALAVSVISLLVCVSAMMVVYRKRLK